MSDGIWVVPPEWKVEGGGGGGTGGTVSWGDIKNKPTEFKPRPHKHEIEDVNNLESALYNKVDREIGKGLSTNDFTNEDKDKLDSLGGDSSSYVQSVNNMLPDKSGNVNVTKEQIGLGLLEDKQYTPLTDFENHVKDDTKHVTSELVAKIDSNTTNIANSVKKEEFETEVSRLDKEVESVNTDLSVKINENSIALQGKVDSVDGKGLSSNDFTKEYKDKLDSVDTSKKYVQTVNGVAPDTQGDVKVDKSSVGLSKLENKDYTPLDDFTSYKTSTEASLALKVDKVEGKQLSTNDYTTEDKNKLDSLPSEIDTGVMTVNSIAPDDNGNLDLDFVTSDMLDSHTENTEIHLSEDDRGLITQISNKVDKEPNKQLSTNDFTDEYKTKIDTNSVEIETIKESIGNMKGTIISSEEPEEKYEGLIWYEIDSVE